METLASARRSWLGRVTVGAAGALCLALVSLACLWGAAACAPEASAGGHTWSELSGAYLYDRSAPLNASVSRADAGLAGIGYVTERIEFDSVQGGKVTALLVRPGAVPKPPVVLALHGLGGDKSIATVVAGLLPPGQFAVMAVDDPLHGERRQTAQSFLGPDLGRSGELMRQAVLDNLRALDYLQTRADLETTRIGLFGVSLGAMLGSIVAGLDPRIGYSCLIVGGGRWDLLLAQTQHPAGVAIRTAGTATKPALEALWAVEPANYVGHIAPRPLLMVNGDSDDIVPRDCAEALWKAAGEPKQIHWYKGGHAPPPAELPTVLNVVRQWVQTVAVGPVVAGRGSE